MSKKSSTPLIITSVVVLLLALGGSFAMITRSYKVGEFTASQGKVKLIHLFDRDVKDALENNKHAIVLKYEGTRPQRVYLQFSRDRVKWLNVQMSFAGDTSLLAAELDGLKKGQRWFYRFSLDARGSADNIFTLGPDRDFYVTFEGKVPAFLIASHVALMLITVLLYLFVFHFILEGLINAAGTNWLYRTAFWGLIIFTFTAFVIGPPISGYAFGEPFGAWPFGSDITDTKSFYLIIFWLVPLILRKGELTGNSASNSIGGRAFAWWCAVCLIVSLIVFLIPHSLFVQN